MLNKYTQNFDDNYVRTYVHIRTNQCYPLEPFPVLSIFVSLLKLAEETES